jgi:hypothetical protein
LSRPGFRENAVLEEYVHERLPAAAITLEALRSGSWLESAGALLASPRGAGGAADGASRAAAAIAAQLDAVV